MKQTSGKDVINRLEDRAEKIIQNEAMRDKDMERIRAFKMIVKLKGFHQKILRVEYWYYVK